MSSSPISQKKEEEEKKLISIFTFSFLLEYLLIILIIGGKLISIINPLTLSLSLAKPSLDANVTNLINVTFNSVTPKTITTLQRSSEMKDGTNILGLIVFCSAYGIVLQQTGPSGKNNFHHPVHEFIPLTTMMKLC